MVNELLGTANLERLLARSDYLEPEIAKNDKGVSWDGHICVYRTKVHSVDNVLRRVPIQVKKEFEPPEDKPIGKHNIRLSDLRNYKTEHGTLYFKVYTDRAGKNERFFYKGLLDGDVDRILAAARGKGTVSVQLDPFPTETEKIDALVLAFARAMRDNTKPDGEKLWEDYARAASLPAPASIPKQESVDSPYLYNAETVGFHGRDGEMERLRAFLNDDRAFCWWGVVGEGGAGKSRLAYELLRELSAGRVWNALELGVNGINDLPKMSSEDFNAAYAGPTLLIVDYVQRYAATLGAWIDRLAADDFGRSDEAPLRILLLERADKDANGAYPWEDELLRAADEERLLRARYEEIMELGAPDNRALRDIMLDFAVYLRAKEPELAPLDEDGADKLLEQLHQMPEVRGRPLFAMLLADAALHRPNVTAWSWESLLNEQIKRERRLLKKRLDDLGGTNPLLQDAVLMLRLVATVLGVSGDPTRETVAALCPDEMAEVSQAAREAHVSDDTLLRRLGLLSASLEQLRALRPDLFGEYLALDFLRRAPEKARQRLFAAVLTDRAATQTFFLRLLRDFGGLIQTEQGFVDWLFPAAVPDDESAAALTRVLRTLFEGARVEADPTDPNGADAYVSARDEAARASLAMRMKTYADALRGDGLPAAYALHNYADTLYFMGDYPAAARYYRRALRIEERLAPDSPDLATTCNNLAGVYRAMGDFPKALEFYEESLTIKEKVLGREHPSTATTYNNLAGVYQAMGDFHKALEFFDKALAIVEKVLGREHPYTAATYNNLAGVYRAMGDYPKALEFYEKDRAISEKVLGREHPDTATTYNNLAGVYYDMGDFHKALEFYDKALAISEKVLGREHPDTATTYNNLAGVYKAMVDFPKALEFYEKTLAIREKVLGREHPSTAATYNNLALTYQAMGDFPKALAFYDKALAIVEKVLGREHPSTATTYNNLAGVYRAMGDFPRALEFYDKTLAVFEKVLGREHPDTAATCNNLGTLYLYMQKPGEAVPWLRRALAVLEKVLGAEHPNTKTARESLEIAERLAEIEKELGAERFAVFMELLTHTPPEP